MHLSFFGSFSSPPAETRSYVRMRQRSRHKQIHTQVRDCISCVRVVFWRRLDVCGTAVQKTKQSRGPDANQRKGLKNQKEYVK